MKKIALLLLFLSSYLSFSQVSEDDLTLTLEDVYVEIHSDGFHLFVRKKPKINSILLTEAFETPDKRKELSTYSFRALEYNPINGDEIRLLNGRVFENKVLRSLTSSTPVKDNKFKEAFHILIPPKIKYGFPPERHGEHDLSSFKLQKEPFWFSIRTFEKKYNDYTASYKDNAYQLFARDEQDITANFEQLKKAFSSFSKVHPSFGGDDIALQVKNILNQYERENDLEVVLVVDATASMKKHIESLKNTIVPFIIDDLNSFSSYKIGLVFYKDYFEDFLVRSYEFGKPEKVESILKYINVDGGGDYPEAVFEGLDAAVNNFEWTAKKRVVIIIGDAPPHEKPRGKVMYEDVLRAAQEKQLEIHSIIFQDED